MIITSELVTRATAAAYDEYTKHAGLNTKLPAWGDLPPDHQQGWRHATLKAFERYAEHAAASRPPEPSTDAQATPTA